MGDKLQASHSQTLSHSVADPPEEDSSPLTTKVEVIDTHMASFLQTWKWADALRRPEITGIQRVGGRSSQVRDLGRKLWRLPEVNLTWLSEESCRSPAASVAAAGSHHHVLVFL